MRAGQPDAIAHADGYTDFNAIANPDCNAHANPDFVRRDRTRVWFSHLADDRALRNLHCLGASDRRAQLEHLQLGRRVHVFAERVRSSHLPAVARSDEYDHGVLVR
jgi:hypothetical protein